MIGPGGLLLVVPTYMQFPVTVLLVGLPKTFDFIIESDILSRVEMLLVGRYEKKATELTTTMVHWGTGA
jgi:hypothetical protein